MKRAGAYTEPDKLDGGQPVAAVRRSSEGGKPMIEPAETYATAESVRTRNAELDRALLAEIEQIDPAQLHTPQGEGEWTLAELLGHLGEFPAFFAADLAQDLDAPGTEIGRTKEYPGRLQAVAEAPQKELSQLRARITEAFAAMAATLARLQDADLKRTINNRKFGEEPMVVYLDRYVVGHKAEHLEQLQQARGQATS